MARSEVPVIRIGRCVRVPRAALMEWIAEQTVAPPEDLARLAMTGGRRAYGDVSIYHRADGRGGGGLVLPVGALRGARVAALAEEAPLPPEPGRSRGAPRGRRLSIR